MVVVWILFQFLGDVIVAPLSELVLPVEYTVNTLRFASHLLRYFAEYGQVLSVTMADAMTMQSDIRIQNR